LKNPKKEIGNEAKNYWILVVAGQLMISPTLSFAVLFLQEPNTWEPKT
jgi:hypothetical protein